MHILTRFQDLAYWQDIRKIEKVNFSNIFFFDPRCYRYELSQSIKDSGIAGFFCAGGLKGVSYIRILIISDEIRSRCEYQNEW